MPGFLISKRKYKQKARKVVAFHKKEPGKFFI
jgi:hypothetical protein